MTRIPSCPESASLAVLALLFCLSSGCLSDNARQGPPRLIVTPASAFEGDVLSLTLSAEGMDLTGCANTADALGFEHEGKSALITVHRIDPLVYDTGKVRAYIEIDYAAVGEYVVLFYCNATTTLQGAFRVKETPSELGLTLNPTSAAANTFNNQIILTTDVPFFNEDEDVYVVFGDGETVWVTEEFSISEYELEVKVNVDASTPEGSISVTAINGEEVARGIFEIDDRIKASISVSPDEVERQGVDELVAATHTLTIRAEEGIDFIESDPDAGIDESEATTISFPEEPGIHVSDFSVINATVSTTDAEGNPVTKEQKQISAIITVDKLAMLRATPLQVTTGETVAWTDLSIRLPADTPYLKIENQNPIPRNGESTLVFAKAVNFDFSHVTAVTCLESGCQVNGYLANGDPPKKMDIDVTVAHDFPGSFATLEVKTDDYPVVQERMRIGDAEVVSLSADPEYLTQGDNGPDSFVTFSLTGGMPFNATPTGMVLKRSGLLIKNQAINAAQLIVWIDVAEDAPTGPAFIQVTSGDNTYVAPLYIKPSEQAPYVTIRPGATLKKRNNSLVLHLASFGFTMSPSIDDYWFDDPALQVTGIDLDPSGTNDIGISVSPVARTDMSVLYVNGLDGQAAATFRVLDPPTIPVLKPNVDAVARGTTETITLKSEGIQFKQPGLEIPDNIGVHASRPQDGNSFVFDLTAEAMPEHGSPLGGWIGFIIDNDLETYLMRIKIDTEEDDNSLTAVMTTPSDPNEPAEVPKGWSGVINAELPPQIEASPSALDVRTDLAGTYAASPQITSSHTVSFYLDVTYGVSDKKSIPVFITTDNGAAVGFIKIVSSDSQDPIKIEEEQPWSDPLPQEQPTAATIVPGPVPSFFSTSLGRPGFANLTATLVAGNRLDLMESTENGYLWLADEDDATLIVQSDDETIPSEMTIWSQGRRAVPEAVLETSNDTEWTMAEDKEPCGDPFLGLGTIEGALDIDRIRVKTLSCQQVAVVLARDLSHRPWETPDLWLEARDLKDTPIAGMRATGWPTSRDPDPRLLLEPGMEEFVIAVGAELGSAGTYLMNIRSPYLIAEISRASANPYIELELLPGADINGLELVLIDPVLEATIATMSFSGLSIVNDGIVVIAGAPMLEADIVDAVAMLPETGPFTVALLTEDEVVLDMVQFGEGLAMTQEGEPISDLSEAPFFFRPAGVDTNDNEYDFAPAYVGTPGR